MIRTGARDRRRRLVSLREVGDDWRAVADVAPLDRAARLYASLGFRPTGEVEDDEIVLERALDKR